MPAYRPDEIEKKWQAHWKQHRTFHVDNHSEKPKYYVLDMFPYPSGAGLHVGHPLGYIASDIVTRYKRLQGYNVLHPMGFDSFGLPAEQYAIQTGQHPALTTEQNIATYIQQLSSLGFSYDWERELRTSDAGYYKWTQWIFLKLFNSWYNLDTNRAEPLTRLTAHFAEHGSEGIRAAGNPDERLVFTAGQWQLFTEHQKLAAVLPYRLAYQQETYVNWCPGLGTVLSNDEVKDGLSERGGYPVERRLMPQWNLRITAYADRLLRGLDTLDWPEPVKEMQRNWIGKSTGASVRFPVYITDVGHAWGARFKQPEEIEVFTTRVDTIYGVTFLVLAPEHPLTLALGKRAYEMGEGHPVSGEIWQKLQAYVEHAKNRSERERQADTKTVSGANTGFYVRNPFTNTDIPVWTADYVLAGYGTGAVMAVPSGDQRDWTFATHFGLPIVPILDAQQHLDQHADPTKEGRYINSGIINGLTYREATAKLLAYMEETATSAGYVALDTPRGYPPNEIYQEGHRIGEPKITYRLHDAIFGRQRYWGEPIPIYYKDGTAYGIAETDLPLRLPEIDEYRPTETGEPPLGRAHNWRYRDKYPYELSTMPGWAGSSWYYLRYMDPTNETRLVSEAAEKYWGTVDLYVGGAEHATGHLLYARFWYLFLKDLGMVSGNEPFQKLINQGMILGRSSTIYLLPYLWSIWVGFETTIEVPDPISLPHVYISKGVLDRARKGQQNEADKAILEAVLNQAFNEWGIKSSIPFSTEKVPVEYEGAPWFNVDISLVKDDILDLERFKKLRSDYNTAYYITEPDGSFICGSEIEKMSKSKHNVVNPDVLVRKYGADALRLYEMFLGPLEQYKPWNTLGITGVTGFLKKFWRLFHPEDGPLAVTDDAPTPAELKVLHKAIKKVQEDIDKFSFNTSVSVFMITVNELAALHCHKRAVLEPLTILVSPYAPHLAEELWQQLGHAPGSISHAGYPEFREEYLAEATVSYPIALNGKVREVLPFAAAATPADIEATVRASDFLARFADGKPAKKVIVVPGRMVNVVV